MVGSDQATARECSLASTRRSTHIHLHAHVHLCHNARKQRWQEKLMFTKTTHTGKEYLAERTSPVLGNTETGNGMTSVSKLISRPQYSVTYRTESWNMNTNRWPPFSQVLQKRAWSPTRHLPALMNGRDERENSKAGRLVCHHQPFLCPPRVNHPLCLQSNWHSPMSSGKINSREWLAMDLPAVCFLRTVSISPSSMVRSSGPLGNHEVGSLIFKWHRLSPTIRSCLTFRRTDKSLHRRNSFLKNELLSNFSALN